VGNYEQLFSETKSQVQTAIANIEQEQARVSKETQWRVTDCERLLETRVNETYVKDYVKSIQQQLLEKVTEIMLINLDKLKLIRHVIYI